MFPEFPDLPHVTLIVLYEYHTCLDLCRQDSWLQLSFLNGLFFHLSLVNWARLSTKRIISKVSLTKHFQNEAVEVSQR